MTDHQFEANIIEEKAALRADIQELGRRADELRSNMVGVIVARFQIDELSPGHRKLITEVAALHDELIIILGVGRTPNNATNPLSYEARKVMVEQYIEGLRQYVPRWKTLKVQIASLVNERYNDVWSQKLDTLTNSLTDRAFVYYTGRDGFKQWYSGLHEVLEIDTGIECSATQRRLEIIESPNFADPKFRAGIIYAMNTKPFQTYRTVDMALIYAPGEGKGLEILLGRKKNEKGWRLPGGFVEEERNETFAQAAAREMYEETGAISETGWKLAIDFPMPDEWRIKYQRGVSHSTMLLVGWAMTREAKAADDLSEVKWMKLAAASTQQEDDIMPEHRPLINYLYQLYIK
jgi:ADP-ribose pyrophosphatase YjhB (NUDIX family)